MKPRQTILTMAVLAAACVPAIALGEHLDITSNGPHSDRDILVIADLELFSSPSGVNVTTNPHGLPNRITSIGELTGGARRVRVSGTLGANTAVRRHQNCSSGSDLSDICLRCSRS